MSYFVKVGEFFSFLKEKSTHPTYKDVSDIKKPLILSDSSSVLPALPPGIPCVPVPFDKKKDKKKQDGATFYKKLMKAELTYSPLAYCCGLASWFEQKPDIFEHARTNQISSFLREIEKDKKWAVTLDYKGISVKPECAPLDCKVNLIKSTENPTLFIIHSIEYQGEQITSSSPLFSRVKEIAYCSFITTATIRDHFLYSHLLTVQTIYSTAAFVFPSHHPIYQFIHPHGYEINTVNQLKGNVLVNDCFIPDFSFDTEELQKLLVIWMEDFQLDNLTAPTLLKRLGLTDKTVSTFPAVETAWKLWNAFSQYVNKVLIHAYRLTDSKKADAYLNEDPLLVQWYLLVRGQRFSLIPPLPLTFKRLSTLLTTYLYVSVYYHEWFGDATTLIADHANLQVPSLNTVVDIRKLIASKQFFHLIFQEVIRPQYLFQDSEWVQKMEQPFRSYAEELQKRVASITPMQLELGINK